MLRRLWKFRLLWSSIFVGDVILLWYRAGEAVEATVKSKSETTLVVLDVDTTATFPQHTGVRVKGNDELVRDVSRNALKLSYGDDPSGFDGGAFLEFFELPGWNIPSCGKPVNDEGFKKFLYSWKKDRNLLSDYYSLSVCDDAINFGHSGMAYLDLDVSTIFTRGYSIDFAERNIPHELGHLQGLVKEGSRNLHVDQYLDAPNWDSSTHCIMSYSNDPIISKELDLDCIYRIRDAK